jgi:8-oxo-dGTP diphosphatase
MMKTEREMMNSRECLMKLESFICAHPSFITSFVSSMTKKDSQSRLARFAPHLWLRLPSFVRRWGLWFAEPRFNVTVSAVVTDERGRVLLLEHKFRERSWGIPGGYLEKGEQPEDGLKRELREETGLEVDNVDIAFARTLRGIPQVEIIFRCQARADNLKAAFPNFEIKQARWFAVDELPPEIPASQKRLIERALSQSFKSQVQSLKSEEKESSASEVQSPKTADQNMNRQSEIENRKFF